MQVASEFSVDPVASARAAGLRYVSSDAPGLSRRRSGKGWVYLDSERKPVRDKETLQRIRSLVIPPAWKNVWISPDAKGHLQAVGIDARGRKQYRYHPRYREVRDATKFARMAAFGAALPSIRKRVQQHLRLKGLPREKVLATLVRLLDTTGIRVGNEEYAKQNQSYGLTTLRSRHVKVKGASLQFRFRGKSGVDHWIDVKDRRIAKIVRECQEIPGQELFHYLDEAGEPVKVFSEDLNEYIREIAGEEFSAKDFRTWNGTCAALRAFQDLGPAETETAAKKSAVDVVKKVAQLLGNRPATCRKYYIHPAVSEAYLAAGIADVFLACRKRRSMSVEEVAVLRLIERAAGGKTATAVRRKVTTRTIAA